MRQKSRWKLFWFSIFIFKLVSSTDIDGDEIPGRNAQKSIFSPRMDYNQWKPLGRGDPLKNDPTFDYVPPVLDHVHYWVDPKPHQQANTNGENGQKTEILLLGVSSKKPATVSGHHHTPIKPPVTAEDRRDTLYESYPKYYQDKGSNYYSHHTNQRIARPNYFPSMTSQIIPSIMSLGNKIFDRTTYPKEQNSRVPYTVLMPPPVVTSNPNSISQYSEPLLTTPITQKTVSYEPITPSQPLPAKNMYFTSSAPTNGVTVQESNLIYQSSSLGNHKEFEAVPSVNWELAASTESNKNSYKYNQHLTPPKPFMQIKFSHQNLTNKVLEASDSNHNINYVTPPPLRDDQVIFKGIVSDDNEIANSYVKIEKPEAQMDHRGVNVNNIHPMPVIYSHAEALRSPNNLPPVDILTIRDMETMKPPPVTQSPVYTRPVTSTQSTESPLYITTTFPTKTPVYTRPVTQTPSGFKLSNPVTNIDNVRHDYETTNLIGSSSSITNTFVTTPEDDSSFIVSTLPTISSEINTVLSELAEKTTLSPPTGTTVMTTTDSATTMQTLTTDTLFKHYRQPAEPLRGPMYLIIQGHSKVKTYKPAKQINGIMVQETNEIPYYRDQIIDYDIKHLHGFESKDNLLAKAEHLAKQRQARTGNLQTLKHAVQTGLGAIHFDKQEQEVLRRSDVDLQETDLEVGYEVVDSKDVTSEKYHKGIVEEARKLKN